MASFFAELKRRNVYKVGAAYMIVAWLLIQLASILFPTFEAPPWVMKVFIAVVAAGFPLALVFAWAFELTPEGIKRTENVAPGESVTRQTGRKLMWLAAVAALLAAVLFAYQFSGGGKAPPPPAAAADKSIAVLPFENRSAQPENAYLADGIQDEILTRLAKIEDLRVISRTSTQRYKNSSDSVAEIAKQLGVAHVLEGSVQKVGEQVRVNVQLIKTANDAHLWAEVYDRKLADIFAVQSDIAETVARALQVRLSSTAQKAIGTKPTENADAYDAYLRGLAIWNSVDLSPPALQRMATYLSRAVELDPEFARAWAMLSAVETSIYAHFEPTAQRLASAKRAVDTAFRLQPDLGDAHFALGLYRYRGQRDYEGALKSFEEAIHHGVNKAMSLEFSAYVKRRQGKFEEALGIHQQSQLLDPRNAIIYSEQAVTLRALRRFSESRAALDRALEITPDAPLLLAEKAQAFHLEGEFDAAKRLLDRVPLDPQQTLVMEARVANWLALRRFDDVIRLLSGILSVPETLPKHAVAVYRSKLGFARLGAGDADGAAADLRRARDELERLRAESATGEGFLEHLITVDGLLRNKPRVEENAARVQPIIANDAFVGPAFEEAIAAARAHLGEGDAAIAILERLLAKPSMNTRALLRADPMWDPLRGHPRFQKLVEQPRS
jgi:TolB-like protein/Tfp pilus assembly protein PilF